MFRVHVLIVRRSKLYYAASIGGRPVHSLREDSQLVYVYSIRQTLHLLFGGYMLRPFIGSSSGSGVPSGGFGVFNPLPPEIPKALQNHAKLNPIVKTVKNC